MRRLAGVAVCGVLVGSCSSGESDRPGDTVQPSPTETIVPPVGNTEENPAVTTPTLASTLPDTDTDTATTDTSSATSSAPLSEPVVQLTDVAQLDQPVDVTARPSDGRVFAVEQAGRVVAFDDLSSDVVLDISDLTAANGEQGLLGLAFDRDDDLAYVDFTDTDGNTVVAEFTVDPDDGTFDHDSYREVLTVVQPYSNHNGGQLAFGPDSMLYIGLGDGGSAGDPDRTALDLSSRLGKILRIDPAASADQPFTVPADNPFVDRDDADPTIWSYGLRNPWKFSFDPVTGDLWIADVGQGAYEEIDHATATDRLDAGRGLDFGWSALEGNEPFNDDQDAGGATPPVYVYSHDDGRCSVSGGVRYRGETMPDLAGWYVFGDYCTGQIWALDPAAPPDRPRVVEIADLPGLSAIAQGPRRELYAVSNAGTVARFDPA